MRVFPDYKGPMVEWPHLETIPNAKETLSILRSSWIVALATNAVDSKEDEIRQALACADLNELVDKVYCYQRIGHKKSSPAFFEFVLLDLGLESKNIFMVGDNYEEDVLSANKSGMRAVWFNPRSDEKRSGNLHQTIHDLRDLHKTLNDWILETDG